MWWKHSKEDNLYKITILSYINKWVYLNDKNLNKNYSVSEQE